MVQKRVDEKRLYNLSPKIYQTKKEKLEYDLQTLQQRIGFSHEDLHDEV